MIDDQEVEPLPPVSLAREPGDIGGGFVDRGIWSPREESRDLGIGPQREQRVGVGRRGQA